MEEDNCVFCDRNKFEERIITEIDDFYIIASLGQITNGGYTLLIPKEHVSCMGVLPLPRTTSAIAIAIKIRNALSQEFRFHPFSKYPITAFEYGVVGQSVKHAHLHFLPVFLDLTSKIFADFPGFQTSEISNYLFLSNLYKECSEPYLFWTIPNGEGRVLWNPPAPMQYLRIVIAELLGYPERGNWRNVDPELDKKLWQETIIRLKPHFCLQLLQ